MFLSISSSPVSSVGKNSLGYQARESNLGLPYSKPRHYHLSYVIPWRIIEALKTNLLPVLLTSKQFFLANFFVQHLIRLAKNMLLPLQSLDDVGENLMSLLSQAQGRSPRHAALTGLAQNTETFSPAALIRVKKNSP
jgi:hypothetical protein